MGRSGGRLLVVVQTVGTVGRGGRGAAHAPTTTTTFCTLSFSSLPTPGLQGKAQGTDGGVLW